MQNPTHHFIPRNATNHFEISSLCGFIPIHTLRIPMDLSVNCNTVSPCGEKTSMKSSEYRKVIKPLLERRRRARINSCLDELKQLIMESTENENADASKLEKADILELTVQHLRNLRRTNRHQSVITPPPSVEDKFRAGFAECAQEVSAFLSSVNGVDHNSKCRLLSHLSHHMSRVPPASLHQRESLGENPCTPPPSPISSPFHTSPSHTPEYSPISPITHVNNYQSTDNAVYVWPVQKRSSEVPEFYVKEQRGKCYSPATASSQYHPYSRPTVDVVNASGKSCWRPW